MKIFSLSGSQHKTVDFFNFIFLIDLFYNEQCQIEAVSKFSQHKKGHIKAVTAAIKSLSLTFREEKWHFETKYLHQMGML